MIPPSVERSLQDGATFTTFAGEARSAHVDAGVLHVTSGKVVAADPMLLLGEKPLAARVPVGSFPVILTILRYDDGDERIAAARLIFDDAAPVEWAAAEPPSFFVDSGGACLCDNAVRLHVRKLSPAKQEAFFRRVTDAMEENYRHTRSWGAITPGADGGANLIAFSSGFGDGGYGAYLGYDRKHQPLCLLLDFGLLLTGEEIDDMGEQEPFEA